MAKHICALIICTVASAIVCGIIGEVMWPSGPYALIGSLFGFACVASIAAPIAYVVAALVLHEVRTLRKENSEGKRSIAGIAPVIGFLVTVAAAIGFGIALRLHWIGR